MAKVLVTGGAGFIGSHLCDRLAERGDEVVVLDDLSLGSRSHLSQLEGKVHFIEDRVQNIKEHMAALEGVTQVFHMAALISGYDSLKEPDAYIGANLIGMARLLEAASELPKVRIIFASSSTVYGNQSEAVRTEADTPEPITMYALSKFAGEHMLAMYRALYGYEYVCLRLFNVYGPRQNPDHPYANVTCKFSHAAAHGDGVKLYGDGDQSRDFVYVDDVVEAFLRASGPTPRRLYNVGTGKDHSIKHLLAEVQRLAAAELAVEQCDSWPNDIRAIRADISRLETDLGFKPHTHLSEGLKRTIAYFRARTR